MITGFNTDVKFDGVTYHVQTEDKGLDTPLILSLIYQHGTILASKRSNYEDLIASGFDEKILEARLKKQHTLMCAAIQTGRIDDLKRMTLARAKRVKSAIQEVEQKDHFSSGVILPSDSRNESASPNDIELPIQVSPLPLSGEILTAEIVETIWDIPMIEDVTIIESDEFFEEGFMLSPDAISIVEDFEVGPGSIKQELKIKFLADYMFRAGDKKNINILVCRGIEEAEVEDASVMIKVLGSDFRPLIFHARSDKHGVASVFVKVPIFRTGRAALLVRASIGGEETEMRRVIFHQ